MHAEGTATMRLDLKPASQDRTDLLASIDDLGDRALLGELLPTWWSSDSGGHYRLDLSKVLCDSTSVFPEGATVLANMGVAVYDPPYLRPDMRGCARRLRAYRALKDLRV